MARPLPVFGSVLKLTNTNEAPQNVRVFENGRFLYGSFYGGREMILDVRAHDRMDLLQYWHEWMKSAPTDEELEPDTLEIVPPPEHGRVPIRPALEEPPGEYLTSIGTSPRPRRRMTLEEFLVA